MKLLRATRPAEASADYLYARIRSRRSRLGLGGTAQQLGHADPHRVRKAEYLWVYQQLNSRLRILLLPVFEYEELHNIVLALRYLAARDRSALAEVLNGSLLAKLLCDRLLSSTKLITAVTELERLLKEDYPFCDGLTDLYLKQGPGGLEQRLNGGYLQQAALRNGRSGTVQSYFRYLIDMRNLLALYKHLHWQITQPPHFVDGGTISLAVLRRCWSGQDSSGLSMLIGKVSGSEDDSGRVGVEEVLSRGLNVRLRRFGRDPLQVGVVLDYLWRCRSVARQRGLEVSRGRVSGSRDTELAL